MRFPAPTHVAIALGGAIAPATQFVLWGGSTAHAWALAGLTGATTGAAYSLHRVVKAHRAPEELRPERRAFLTEHGGKLLAVWGAALLAAGCAFVAHAVPLVQRLLAPGPVAVAAVGGALTVAYAFLPWRAGGRRAAGREWPGAKLPWIALTWAVLSVALPAHLVGEGAEHAWLAFLGQTAFVAGITVPFDVRDLDVDAPGMRTLPHLIGPSQAIRIALFLVAFSAAAFVSVDLAAGRYLVSAAALLVVALGSRARGTRYYDLLLDGLLAAQGMALWI